MLAYAHLDPASAMDSQRVFFEAQEPDGYIPYRIGPYVVRTFPVEGEGTTSAPFYLLFHWEGDRIAQNQVGGERWPERPRAPNGRSGGTDSPTSAKRRCGTRRRASTTTSIATPTPSSLP